MDFGISTHCHDEALMNGIRISATSKRFAYWRWLLFTAMARFELREDRYLRIPTAKTKQHVVIVKIS
jgi:hypothetical protein